MKQDPRGPIFAVVLILALGFGVYWGVVVAPQKQEFWARVNRGSAISSARIEMDGKTIALDQKDAEYAFNLMRSASDYSPNHPRAIRQGLITFNTDQGDISFIVSDTSNQGVLLDAFSSGETGWDFGTRRCDQLSVFLNDIKK